MAKKLNIQKQGFTSVSDAYNSLLGVKSDTQYVNIPLSLLDEIDNQPFPINDDKVAQIADSIEAVGVIEPLIIVKNGERYYILSGRHRFRACRQLGKKEIPCFIREMSITDPEARYILLATNTDRNNEYSPTVYARAYSEQLELLKKLGKKSTVSAIAEQNGMSRKQIYRYIRLTNLISEIQEWVDKGLISIEAAVELSFLSDKKQLVLFNYVNSLDTTYGDISKNFKVVCTKNIHTIADKLSDEEFDKNINIIVSGEFSEQKEEDDSQKSVSNENEHKDENLYTSETSVVLPESPENISQPDAKILTEKKKKNEHSQTSTQKDTEEQGLTVLPEEEEKTFSESTEWESTIKGYLILAAQNADFSREQIKDLIDGLSCAMKEHDKTEAENTYLYW